MPFNIDKCKVLHVGFNNIKEKYVLDGCDLSAVSDEKDLGVIVSSDLKMSKQCKKASSTANKVLGMINRTITTKKSWNGYEGLDKLEFFRLNPRISRGHKFKLIKPRARLDIKKYCFSHRVVEHWNNLPAMAVESDSINCFKGHVYRYLCNVGGLV